VLVGVWVVVPKISIKTEVKNFKGLKVDWLVWSRIVKWEKNSNEIRFKNYSILITDKEIFSRSIVKDNEGEIVRSFDFTEAKDGIDIRLGFNSPKVVTMPVEQREQYVNESLYYYWCILENNNPLVGVEIVDRCNHRAREWLKKYGTVFKYKLFKIKEVRAGCIGDYECGRWITSGCYCVDDPSYACYYNGLDCGNVGTCAGCSSTCDGYGASSCDGWTASDTCTANHCSSSECQVDGCNWCPNEVTCTTSCGYSGGWVSNGLCGWKWCPATAACCTAVNGGWSVWTTCSSCSQTRYCNNPSPSCGGLQCLKLDGTRGLTETRSCGYVEGTLSAWVPSCVPACGQAQTRTCSGVCGGDCNDASLTNTCASTDATTPGQVAIVEPNGTLALPDIVTSPVTLQWNNTEANHAYTDSYEYRIYNVTNGNWFVSSANAGSASSTSVSVGGLALNTTYYWQIRAVNSTCAGYPASTTYGTWSALGYFKINSPPVLNTAPTNFLVIQNSVSTVVPPETGSRNQICQLVFVDPIATPRQIKFVVTVTDADGGDKIVSAGVRLNGLNWVMSNGTLGGSWSLISVNDSTSGNNRTYTFFMQLGEALNNTTLYNIEAIAADSYVSTGWVDSTRDLKIWDCEVPASGTIYDISNSDVCNATVRYPATAELYFQSVNFDGIPPAADVVIDGYSDSDYQSPPPLTWGRDYAISLNSDINGIQPTNVLINELSCQDVQVSLDQNTVDAYVADVGVTIDLGSIRNQEPWWQMSGGGVVAGSQINNLVPITCALPGCVPAMIKELSIGASSDGGAMAISINNNSGCQLNTDCWYSSPRNTYRTLFDGRGEKTSYEDLYNKIKVGSGEGIVYSTGKKMSDLTGDTGVVFVNGDLEIDENRSVAVGTFLMIVVNGRIDINSGVDTVDGVLVADGDVNIPGDDATVLNINGLIYSNADINISRGLAGDGNNGTPAVNFNYRADFLFSMPAEVSKVLSNWRVGQ